MYTDWCLATHPLDKIGLKEPDVYPHFERHKETKIERSDKTRDCLNGTLVMIAKLQSPHSYTMGSPRVSSRLQPDFLFLLVPSEVTLPPF
jgi:hypothetical protein